MAHRPIYERLPKIWKELDTDGTLERFLSVIDSEMIRIHGKVLDLLDLRSINLIPDKYLPLMAPLVGHKWRDDRTRIWNRNRVRHAIYRHSYKGTMARFEDTAVENGATSYEVQDNASTLLILGKQGHLGTKDCYLTGPDFYHEGAFMAFIDASVDYDSFREDLKDTLPSTTKWYFQLRDMFLEYDEVSVTQWESGIEHFHSGIGETLGHGRLGTGLVIHPSGATPSQESSSPVYWEQGFDKAGRLGYMHLGVDSWFSERTASSAESSSPVYWEHYADRANAILGKSKLGVDFTFGDMSVVAADASLEQYVASFGGLLTIDTNTSIAEDSISINMGTPQNPLPDDAALIQQDSEES